MGTLRCYDWIENEDGTKTSAVEGMVINGVILGQPLEIDGDPNSAEYDDSMFPNGIIDKDGKITPDEPVEIETIIVPQEIIEIPFVEESTPVEEVI